MKKIVIVFIVVLAVCFGYSDAARERVISPEAKTMLEKREVARTKLRAAFGSFWNKDKQQIAAILATLTPDQQRRVLAGILHNQMTLAKIMLKVR